MFRRLAILIPAFALLHGTGEADESGNLMDQYRKQVLPVFVSYCYDCHGDGLKKGELALDAYPDITSMIAQRDVWRRIRDHIDFRLMPPPDEPSPSDEDRQKLLDWIDAAVFPVDPANPDPGHVTLRRLNRNEYQNTLHDLLDVKVDVASILPPDDSGYGFDNIGDVLTLSPLHLERYLEAARTALDVATHPDPMPPHRTRMDEKKPASHRRLYGEQKSDESDAAYMARVLNRFARHAFRRPPRDGEIDRYLAFIDIAKAQGDGIEHAIRMAMEAMLVSPSFLFREEPTSIDADAKGKSLISEHALASRLSYFLWSTMPDDTLLTLADEGELRAQLGPQIERMILAEKSDAFVSNFAGQWLQLRDMDAVSPSNKHFHGVTRVFTRDMRTETELLFRHVLRENLPARTLLDADFTFINERLAQHYGIAGVEGNEFRRVPLAGTPRRGILNHASILTLTSYPTRTSPVLRGKYILENILNTPPPPPPPNIPQLEPPGEGGKKSSLRQQMERHRDDPSCSSCHALMDPIGFGLENFDGIGAWRDTDDRLPIDPSGTLANGQSFVTAEELRHIIAVDHEAQFHRAIASKMLTYALGRGVEWYDRPAIDEIVLKAGTDDARFHTLIRAVVESVPFQYARATHP